MDGVKPMAACKVLLFMVELPLTIAASTTVTRAISHVMSHLWQANSLYSTTL